MHEQRQTSLTKNIAYSAFALNRHDLSLNHRLLGDNARYFTKRYLFWHNDKTIL